MLVTQFDKHEKQIKTQKVNVKVLKKKFLVIKVHMT